MAPTSKPKLAVTTPVTATFPSEIQAFSAGGPLSGRGPYSAKSPLSAIPDCIIKEEFKTPITPPIAYMDFLKAMSVTSPVIPEKRSGSSSEEDEDAEDGAQDSTPSTASSTQTDCSCKCGNHKSSTAAAASPYPIMPMSAPSGATTFPSLYLPPSPSISNMESPLSATARSPFSARSVRSPFDWDAALKARYVQDCKASKPAPRSVRHIREVVTRTVTYTPRMDPAPKGKRRKTDCSLSQPPILEEPQTPQTAPVIPRSNSA